MTQRLEGKIALITGGSRGIGASIALAFAREGAKVIISSRKQDALDATAAEINRSYPDSTFAKACHTGDKQAIVELIEWAEETVGRPNVLVNNAATNPYFGPMLGISDSQWDKTFDVNLKGYFEPARQVCQRLLQHNEAGSVIMVSSVAGMRAAPMQGVYGMTKAAILSMVQSLAVELGEANIRVNAVSPGLVDTKLAAAIVQTPEFTKHFTDKTALKRYAQPSELAEIFVYLASDESSYVTGQNMVVDGGFTVT